MRQYFRLTRGSGAAVTAHGRDYEWFSPPFLQLGHRSANQRRDLIDAPTADCDGDAHTGTNPVQLAGLLQDLS